MKVKVAQKALHKAVSASSKIEGMSFYRAKRNKAAIKLLKKNGRAFSL